MRRERRESHPLVTHLCPAQACEVKQRVDEVAHAARGGENPAQALASLDCPLMYVRAQSPTDLKRLQAQKPDAMVGQVVGSGHWPMLSAAEQVNAMLDSFLASAG